MRIEIKYILTLIVFLTFSLGLFSQDKSIDSLKSSLINAKHDTTRIKLLSQLSEQCEVENILKFAEPCVKLCEKGLASTAASTTTPKTFYLKHLADALGNIGFLARQEGDIPKALEYHHKSLKIQEEIKDKRGIAS